MRAVRYNVDGNYCVTCGQDKSVKLWNPDRKALLKSYTGHGYEVHIFIYLVHDQNSV